MFAHPVTEFAQKGQNLLEQQIFSILVFSICLSGREMLNFEREYGGVQQKENPASVQGYPAPASTVGVKVCDPLLSPFPDPSNDHHHHSLALHEILNYICMLCRLAHTPVPISNLIMKCQSVGVSGTSVIV